MRENWKYQPLGEIVEIKRGLTYSKNDEVDISGKIVLRSNNVNLDNHQFDFTELKYLKPTFDIPADKYLQKGDLLMCMSNGSKAHLGKVALYDGESDKYAFGGFMAALSHKDSVIGRYLFYAMITPMYKEYIKTLSDGANINNLKVRDIEAFSIPVPPLTEQERIVALLDDQFAKIDALKANAASQLQAAKDLFQSALKQLLTPKEGWESIKLKDLAHYRRGSFPQPYGKKEWYDGDGAMPFVQVAELQEDDFNLVANTAKKISKVAQEYSIFVPHGTVLVSLQGSIGKVAITQYDSYVDRTLAIFIGYKREIVKEFFAYQLKLKFAIEAQKARGTTIKTITKEEFAEFEIRIAPYSEQVLIIEKLNSISEKVKALQANYDQTITLCNDLKQALLKSIFE